MLILGLFNKHLKVIHIRAFDTECRTSLQRKAGNDTERFVVLTREVGGLNKSLQPVWLK